MGKNRTVIDLKESSRIQKENLFYFHALWKIIGEGFDKAILQKIKKAYKNKVKKSLCSL